ncbi:MAG: hypothetical protein ACREPX_03685 [Rhodanobacteraceae bacterium]
MSVPISRRSFRRSRRALGVACCVLMAAGVTAASADSAPARFSIHAAIEPAAAATSNGVLRLHADLVPARANLSGQGYELHGQVESSPSGCSSDTIFENGFDP